MNTSEVFKMLARPTLQKFQADSDGLMRFRTKSWVPPSADDLKIKVITIVHPGQAGHDGAETIAALLRESYTWKGLSDDATDFVANCLLYIMSRTGELVTRALPLTLHAHGPRIVF